jgi:hypothetical protein
MRRLFKFLSSIIFLSSYVVADDAGGSFDNVDIDKSADSNPAGDNPGATPPVKDDKTPPVVSADSNKTEEELKALKAKVDEQDKFIQGQNSEKAIERAVTEIKTRHSDFDEKKVYEYLKELNEKEPDRAAALNNPIGWENVWYQIKPQTPVNDNFYRGRNVAPVDRSDEVFSLVKSGGATLADEADAIAKFL